MEVILYTIDDCARCKLVKQMLNKHNVDYTEVHDRGLMEAKGFISAPTIEIDGQIIDEYTNVLSWLEKNGYYSL